MLPFLGYIDKISTPLSLAAFTLTIILYIVIKKLDSPTIIKPLMNVIYISIIVGVLSPIAGFLKNVSINSNNINTINQSSGINIITCSKNSAESKLNSNNINTENQSDGTNSVTCPESSAESK